MACEHLCRELSFVLFHVGGPGSPLQGVVLGIIYGGGPGSLSVAPLPTQVVLLADHKPENQRVSSTLYGFYFKFLLEFLPWHPSIEAGDVEALVK